MIRDISADSGSGALVTLGDKLVVKVPSDDGVAKLLAEANWLRWIQREAAGNDVRRRFPSVRRMPTLEHPALVLDALPGRSARAAVLAGEGDDLLPLLCDAITFAFDRLARVTIPPSAWATGEWCAGHLERSVRRAASLHAQVARAMARETLPSEPDLVAQLLFDRVHSAVAALRPLVSPRAAVIHGDLHLGNVLVAPADGGFAFIDPRGGWDGKVTFDPAYDVAKLLHEPAYVRAQMTGTTARQRGPLTAIADVSQALARHACGILESADPMIAARATLMTGMHLASVLRLPHTVGYDVPSLLTASTVWLTAGLEAVREKKTTVDCRRVWPRLHAHLRSSLAFPAE